MHGACLSRSSGFEAPIRDFPRPTGARRRAARTARNASAGGLLRRTREELGWDIRDVASALRIRAEYLAALERNTVEGLPGPTYATGFLRAYAEYLGLDGHEIVRRFREEKTGLHTKPELAFPVPLTDRGIPGGGIFLIAVLMAGLAYGTWYYFPSHEHATPSAVEPVPPHLLQLPPPPSPPPPVAIVEAPKPVDTANAVVPPPPSTAAPTPAATPPRTGAAPTTTSPPQSPVPATVVPPAPSDRRRCRPRSRPTRQLRRDSEPPRRVSSSAPPARPG